MSRIFCNFFAKKCSYENICFCLTCYYYACHSFVSKVKIGNWLISFPPTIFATFNNSINEILFVALAELFRNISYVFETKPKYIPSYFDWSHCPARAKKRAILFHIEMQLYIQPTEGMIVANFFKIFIHDRNTAFQNSNVFKLLLSQLSQKCNFWLLGII